MNNRWIIRWALVGLIPLSTNSLWAQGGQMGGLQMQQMGGLQMGAQQMAAQQMGAQQMGQVQALGNVAQQTGQMQQQGGQQNGFPNGAVGIQAPPPNR